MVPIGLLAACCGRLASVIARFNIRGNSSIRSASATIPASSAFRARLSDQSMAASPLMLEAGYRPYPWALAHFPTLIPSTYDSDRISFTIPSANRLQVSLTAPRPRMLVVSSATFMLRLFR